MMGAYGYLFVKIISLIAYGSSYSASKKDVELLVNFQNSSIHLAN